MSIESFRIYAESSIQSAMQQAYPEYPIRFENARQAQPETAWMSFTIRHGKSIAMNLGSLKVDRHVGFVQLDVLVPQRTGTSLGNTLAEFGGKVFRQQNVTLADGATAIFQTPSVTVKGANAGFFRVMMRCSFWRDELAA